MIAAQLKSKLQAVFDEEGHRLVFWYDVEKEFDEGIAALQIDGVQVVRLDQAGSLELKIQFELKDQIGRYLVYAPFAEPTPAVDPLLDVKLYSRIFHADQASIMLSELGLEQQALRAHIAQRGAFFRNQDRVNRLKKWVKPADGVAELDVKMLGVLSKADQPETFSILMKLFDDLRATVHAQIALPGQSAWDSICKFDLAPSFWRLMGETFGYSESSPSLQDLLIRLLVTDIAITLKGTLPLSLRHFALPSRDKALTASVFANHWRNNLHHFPAYNDLSRATAKQLKLESLLGDLDESSLLECMTFEAVEKHLIHCLVGKINAGNSTPEFVKMVVAHRLDGHWTNDRVSVSGVDYRKIYDALVAASDLFELRGKHGSGFSYPDAAAMYIAYTSELHRFDRLYRRFHEVADEVELAGADILKALRDKIEDCYSGWFLDQIGITWGTFIDTASHSLLKEWQIGSIPNQQSFFTGTVAPALADYPQGRVYVVVSDAFRFEAAVELSEELNAKSRFDANLGSQLGVLPSYTALGMAALLPHQSMRFKDGGEVEVDDLPCASLDQRSKVLQPYQGIAIKSEELLSMSRDGGREFIKPWRVVYIYHNQVDAMGDSASTESKTFSAVRTAIGELMAIVSYVINSLNGSLVLVTADHGFLYQDSPPGQTDKSGLESKPEGTIKAKKRYLIGKNLGDATNVWHGDTVSTAGAEGGMEFWIPKGNNRFHFSGGSRFIHGGAMLQEIVVPIVTVKGIRGAEQAREVRISLLGTTKKVVNNMQRFEFIQLEPVSDKVTPLTVTVSLKDGNQHISNEVTLTFDSKSDQMSDRKKTATLVIKSGSYDKKREYYLIVQNKETKVEIERIVLTIELAFGSDF